MSVSPTQLRFFADFIEKELGIIYSQQNYYQLEKRLVDIAKNLGIETPNDLWKKATTEGISGHFKQMLLDVATNNETSFFRDPRLFKGLENHLFPKWREGNPDSTLFRIWSVASSYGQEPYSLAMTLEQVRAKIPTFPRYDIWATDISKRVLERAKEGKYSQLEVQRGLPAPLLVKYFKKKDDDYWYIDTGIRTQVRFAEMNLLNISGVSGKFDIILCRNVLIYQNDTRKKEILNELRKYISPNGYLILGSSESLIGLSDAFEQEIVEGAVFFRRKPD